MKLKNILKGWEEPNAPRRWSRAYSSTNGLTEFEQLGGKDTVSEDKHSEKEKEKEFDLILPANKKIILKADTDKTDRGLIIKWNSSGGYNVQYWYEDPSNVMSAELKGDGESFGDIKNVYLGFHPELGDKEK
jgi:hypothetical protein